MRKSSVFSIGAAALSGPRETDRLHNRGRSPHPPPSGAPSPKGEGKGDRKGRPYGENRAGSVGSANSGAEAGPHQKQILRTQGPVARREFRHSLRFCAPEGICLLQGVTPVNGGPGKGECGHEVPTLSRPRGRFAFFFATEKEGRRPGHGPLEQKSYLWRRNWEHFGPARRGRRALHRERKPRRRGQAPALQTFSNDTCSFKPPPHPLPFGEGRKEDGGKINKK